MDTVYAGKHWYNGVAKAGKAGQIMAGLVAASSRYGVAGMDRGHF